MITGLLRNPAGRDDDVSELDFVQLATELHERGVCPGDLGMLIPE